MSEGVESSGDSEARPQPPPRDRLRLAERRQRRRRQQQQQQQQQQHALDPSATPRAHNLENNPESYIRAADLEQAICTKSCNNIFNWNRLNCTSQLWRDNAQSEETLQELDVGHGSSLKKHSQSTGRLHRQSSGTKTRFSSLLKKLTPGGLRRSCSQPSTNMDPGSIQYPWLIVEFSCEELDGEAGYFNSNGSDCSFDLTVKEALRRKEEHIQRNQTSSSCSVSLTRTSTNQLRNESENPPKPLLLSKPVFFKGVSCSSGESGGSLGGRGPLGPTSTREVVNPTRSAAALPVASVSASAPGGRSPAPRPRASPPPPPSAPATAAARSVAMASLESIGSCSLDAYASSSDGTDPLLSGTSQSPGHEQEEQVPGAVAAVGEGDIVSARTLCSGSDVDSPEYVRKTARYFEGPDGNASHEESDFLNIPVAKKPSYLGLACSLSGYSGLTSYDSKLREGFRTRDKSPAPPHPRPLTTSGMSRSNQPTINGVGKGSEANGFPAVSPPSHFNGTVSGEKSPQPGHSSLKDAGVSSLRESSRQFMSSMLADETDFTQCATMLHVHHLPGPSPSTPKDPVISSEGVHYTRKRSPGTVRIVEFTSQTKSYVSAIVSSTTSRSSLQSNFTSESQQYISEETRTVNGTNSEQSTPKASRAFRVETESTPQAGYSISKSFVQQRIERLYGPGALAQGFFSPTRQQSLSEKETAAKSPDIATSNSSGSVSLPVLRHLRPEFRAQLPLTSSCASRSLQRESRCSDQSQIVQPPILQQQTSVESISDSQPAAPEVPVLVGENIPLSNSSNMEKSQSLNTTKNWDKLKDPNQPVQVEMPLGISSTTSLSHPCKSIDEEEKNGHYFLKVLRSEIHRLGLLVESAEKVLEESSKLPEEAQGKLRAASGQARLLMKQKLQQFEGLCHKNINQSPDEVFPTTAQDLAGFWDMVKLQIDHVDRLFEEIDRLKNTGWVEIHESAGGNVGIAISTGTRRKSSSRRPTSGISGGSKSKSGDEQKKASEGARKKEELAQARKRMMEERRKLLRQQQQQQHQQQQHVQENIEIFIPQENGK